MSEAREGTLLQRILDADSRHDPYPLYDRLRERAVFQEPDGSYVVTGYAEVAALLGDPRLSADPANSPAPPSPPFSFLNMDPPGHDRVRRLTMRHFGPPNDPGRVEAMRPHLFGQATLLIDALRGRDEIDVVADVAYPFPVTVVADLLGVPREDEPKFHVWAEAIVQAADWDPRDRSPSAGVQAAIMELGAYMMGLIQAKRRDPRDDMLSRLANDDGPEGALSSPELTGVAILLLLAGHETTVNLIANGMLTLLRKPDVLARLKAEPGLETPLVEELLRYEPPVHFTFRSTLADVDAGGVTIPAGSAIRLMLACANRDPARFQHADRFIPDRANNAHLGFGSGIHACFGAPLARLEGQVALREMARRLVDPVLLDEPPPYRINPTLRGPRRLRVRIAGVID
ncbi:MAG: cytochrome P450 [Alphaproteobacteria bacterium]|nr:cytochrome P450 [Alphaproteobacteria bacterium]MBU1516103.1 cytochrome P450 [Alphaproteobacteria bacterium]MBU2092682.1 cytochrome P450 [Alphaproteobacteria bacterium]MBU2153793.1 cytochrome P450 [Alphaproteobacteria bacterium]MBU2308421.1 cytochrome P450 [Alphaproteobacteria bacterium]